MALSIGFTEKYFTLWNISIREETIGDELMYETCKITDRFFIQNLSMDESKAIEKAKEKGCKNLSVDGSLRGVSQSWSSKERVESFVSPKVYQFGRCIGSLISETKESSIDYLMWYASEQNNYEHLLEIRKVCVEKFGFVNILGGTPSDDFEVIFRNKQEAKENFDSQNKKLAEDLFTNECMGSNELVGILKHNIGGNGEGYFFVENVDGLEIRLDIKFPNVKENYYGGFSYYLPMDSKGKGKRVKNKSIEVSGDWVYCDDRGSKVFHVSDFKVLKKK